LFDGSVEGGVVNQRCIATHTQTVAKWSTTALWERGGGGCGEGGKRTEEGGQNEGVAGEEKLQSGGGGGGGGARQFQTVLQYCGATHTLSLKTNGAGRSAEGRK